MTSHSVEHGSFRLERTYPAAPPRVFRAWASHEEKDRWFGAGDDFLTATDEYTLDFRVDGWERLSGTLPNGRQFSYAAHYLDIVDAARIIVSYAVTVDGKRNSVSLMTVEFIAVPDGTRVVLTEQGVFLDELDSNAQREEGALDSLGKLGAHLEARVTAPPGITPLS